MKKIVIIGGGPAALMLAAQIDVVKYQVVLYEKKKTVGRKFLVAGEGGLNLTYNSSLEELIACYSPPEFMTPVISQFTNQDLRTWFKSLGVSTFIGSSNRVFPDKTFKPIEVLTKIVDFLKRRGVEFQLGKEWTGWNKEGDLCFENSEIVGCDITVFSMGGASWKVTGSDGKWASLFKKRGLVVDPFRAANCAFGVNWDQNFINSHRGKPLKNIALTYGGQLAKGELVVSGFGLEGNAIYALSQKIQETLRTERSTVLYLDLKPTMTIDQLKGKYLNSRSSDVTTILKKALNLNRISIALLKQFSDREAFLNIDQLATIIKAVPIVVNSPEVIDKAISTLGGLHLKEVDGNFHLKKIPGSYAIGEMLDWYAPTGGYLLQGCFSMGFALAKHLNGSVGSDEVL